MVHRHSDRGSQCASEEYQAVLESFYGTLKTELIYHETSRARDEARRAVFEYIEMFYNGIRRHSTLGYLSPVDFVLAA